MQHRACVAPTMLQGWPSSRRPGLCEVPCGLAADAARPCAASSRGAWVRNLSGAFQRVCVTFSMRPQMLRRFCSCTAGPGARWAAGAGENRKSLRCLYGFGSGCALASPPSSLLGAACCWLSWPSRQLWEPSFGHVSNVIQGEYTEAAFSHEPVFQRQTGFRGK